jgi:hypothetical protein
MDFKSRNDVAPRWTSDQIGCTRRPEPYDRNHQAVLLEIDSPDKSSVFLVAVGGLDEEHGEFTLYGIEAPGGCPMREAFEWGEISWVDFWSHKNWLLQINVPFGAGDPISNYISWAQVNLATRSKFEFLSYRGPYHLKLQQLELSCEHSSWDGSDPIAADRNYRNFMIRHGHRFARNAA